MNLGKWHKISIDGGFNDAGKCKEFRSELMILQKELRAYTKMLADIAEVEDLTTLEER